MESYSNFQTLRRILVVDDNHAVRNVLREVIEYEGILVEVADSGEAALEKLTTLRVDLVLLDVKLPGRSGLDILSEISRSRPGLGVIMMSGHLFSDEAHLALNRGAVAYLDKPIDLAELLDVIEQNLPMSSGKPLVGA